jgi:hypothetical protein
VFLLGLYWGSKNAKKQYNTKLQLNLWLFLSLFYWGFIYKNHSRGKNNKKGRDIGNQGPSPRKNMVKNTLSYCY